MKLKYILIGLSLFLCSCGPSAQEAVRTTEHSFSHPEKVGVLKNGKTVYRVWVTFEGCRHQDRVYYTEDGQLNTNYEVKHGKTTVVESSGVIE